MSNISTNSSGGIGFFGLLTILFIGLKLGGVITWSWLWVLSPLWIAFGIVLLFFMCFAIFTAIFTIFAIIAHKNNS